MVVVGIIFLPAAVKAVLSLIPVLLILGVIALIVGVVISRRSIL